jgi:hypothetical protein
MTVQRATKIVNNAEYIGLDVHKKVDISASGTYAIIGNVLIVPELCNNEAIRSGSPFAHNAGP